MGMRPAMALMPLDREVQKTPIIQRAALCCIFFNLVMFLTIGAPVRATGAQDSRRILSNITDCGYDTTHLQENPQRLG